MTNLNTNLMANALRILAVDAVQKAKSGHPGAPMGMAEMAVALWQHNLNHHPSVPNWLNRDRFVLSNGHASMLIYALLHLTGYKISIEDIKQFRQFGSITPGHPELGITPGVETTTGPLGQGFANAVGMALAEKLFATEFNRPEHQIIDHFTYAFVGDGCLMEGISHEAAALAGAWKLGKLIVLYDSNGISIDGQVQPWFDEEIDQRFASYGWQVIEGVDGHDVAAINEAIALAKTNLIEPTIIICKTSIGKGSPNRVDTSKAHGEPMGAEEIKLIRQQLGWSAEPFVIPNEVYQSWDATAQGEQQYQQWQTKFAAYRAAHPELAEELLRRNSKTLPENFNQIKQQLIEQTRVEAKTVASRKASQLALEFLTAKMPELLGGSADLTGSNLTNTSSTAALRFDNNGAVLSSETHAIGRHINYGVREFGMAAIMNGICIHGGYTPYAGTFLTFADYSRNAIRMAALMRQQVIHVLTHDSIGLGEDGPTHQPIEHVASLRLIPNLNLWRPADSEEAAYAWLSALEQQDQPTALILSRQNLPFLIKQQANDISRGGYILTEPTKVGLDKPAQVVLMATGSEVQLAVAAQQVLAQEFAIAARVVSMPSCNIFDQQDEQYRQAVLPAKLPKVVIEAGQPDLWWKYDVAAVLGISSFGESAPAAVLFEHFGLTVEKLVNQAKDLV